MRIGVDIDGCITEYPAFFAALTNALRGVAKVYVITNRDPRTGDAIRRELAGYGVHFDELEITADKAQFILAKGIGVIFEDTDEYVLSLPASVCVCKVREPGNFCYDTRRWLYGRKTGRDIDA